MGLLIFLCGTALAAIWITQLPYPAIKLGLSAIPFIVFWRQLAHYRVNRIRLTHLSQATSSWLIEVRCGDKVNNFTGVLIKAGYRSASLLVLAVQSKDGRIHDFLVWTDQVSNQHYSYLNAQLAFNTQKSKHRSPRQLL